jgi:hypothetical protein
VQAIQKKKKNLDGVFLKIQPFDFCLSKISRGFGMDAGQPENSGWNADNDMFSLPYFTEVNISKI